MWVATGILYCRFKDQVDFWRHVEHFTNTRSAVTHLWIQTPVKMIQRFKGRAYCRTSMYSKPTNILWWIWFLGPHCFGPRLPWSSWPGDFLLCCSWWLLDVEFWWESPESHGFYPGVVWGGWYYPIPKATVVSEKLSETDIQGLGVRG